MTAAKNKGGRPRIKRSVSVTLVPRSDIDARRLARALLALARQDEEHDGGGNDANA